LLRLQNNTQDNQPYAHFVFQRAFVIEANSVGDGEAGEAAIQTHLYLGEQQDAGLVQMLEPTEMNHHLSRQFDLFA
jgi:hypothetical protein